jgi:hypothetical protein
MAFNYSPKIITDGLVFCLDAANTRSYPGSGTVWSDLSRNGYIGTLTNGPTFDSTNGGSIVFDGVNDNVTTLSNYVFGTENFAINVWFKTNGTQSTNSTLICLANLANITNWQLSFTSNILRFFWSDSNFVNTTYSINNIWTNVNVVRESTLSNGLKIYLNGMLNVTATVASNFTDLVGYRLGVNRGNNAWFKGNIAQTLIYNRALSATEVLQNYNATKGRYGL